MTTKTYYKITFPDNTCYIGCTKNYKRRKYTHTTSFKRGDHHCPQAQNIFNESGFDGWRWEVLFEETGDNKHHIIREHSLIQETPNTLNIKNGRWNLLSKEEKRIIHNKRQKQYDTRRVRTPEELEEHRRKDRERERRRREEKKRSGDNKVVDK